jgi:ATP-dependent Clp protease, protease subunit
MQFMKDTGNILSLHLIGDIDRNNAGAIIGAIEANKRDVELQRVDILLSSSGGYIFPTFTLFDYLKSLKVPINITATGRCQSCALALLQVGTKRISREHTLFGLHPNVFTISEPKSLPDIHSEVKGFEMQNEFFIEMLVHRTRMRREKIERLCEKELLFSPQEALRFGLIDEIEK